MGNSTKICIIGPSTQVNYIGGVATHIKNLLSLECLRFADVIDIGSVNNNKKTNYFRIIINIINLNHKIISGKYTHIFINSSIYLSSFTKLLLILLVLPRGGGRKYDVFFHGGRFPLLNYPCATIINYICRPVFRKVNRFHFLSIVQMDGFSKLFNCCVPEIYFNYATTDDTILPRRASKEMIFRLLFVGRVIKEKGVFELYSAMRQLSKLSGKINLTIIGNGPDLSELQRLSKDLPSGMVKFAGYMTGADLENAYQNADVLILPSYNEAFPYVVIEAMRAGLPIISTNEGALDTLIQDNITGIKVIKEDSQAISDAIMKLYNNQALIKTMSDNCKKYYDEKLSKSVAEKYYSSILQ